jgi:raffinose/stachyose/melibiose transport system permease protein
MKRIKSRWTAAKIIKYAAVYIILIATLYLSVMPIFFTWMAAFKPEKEFLTNPNPLSFPQTWTMENFPQAWTTGKMGQYMLNSVVVSVPTVLGILIIASLAGYAFGKLKFPGRDKLFFFFLFGMMVPGQALIISLFYTVQGLGLINTSWAVILPTIGTAMPFAIFMMRSFYRDLPAELMDSALIDGCNKFQTFLYILAPLTIPALSALLVFEFMWTWNDLQLPLLVLFNDNVRTVPTGLMYFKGKYSSSQAMIATAVTISTVPIIAVYLIFQRSFIRGITAGAVKG